MSNLKLFTLILGFTSLHFASQVRGQHLTSQQINDLGKSVVKITVSLSGGRQKIATGFIYQSREFAITAYHVVAGATNVVVRYEASQAERSGTVQKVYRHADLALIRINNPLNVPPLVRAPNNASVNQQLTALGFYLDAKSLDQRKLSVSSSNELQNILPSKNISEIQNNGCPGLALVIHKLQDNPLLPGFSGCPVFNAQGQVIGIGDGGLENGAYSISWAIPASEISNLMTSTESFSSVGIQATAYFSADIITEDAIPQVVIGGLAFKKLRTRSITEIASSSGTDDLQGLNMMISTLPSIIDKSSILLDIYQEQTSGAVIVIPTGANVIVNGSKMNITDAQGNYSSVIEVIRNLNDAQMMQKTIDFEGSLSENFIQWIVDPQFTYTMPAFRPDGLMVRRKAFVGIAGVNDPRYYVLEAFAFKNGTLLSAYNKKKNFNNGFINQRFQCVNSNFQAAGCNEMVEDLKAWCGMTVAVHLTSFSI